MKLIMLDMDGTLFNNNKEITEENCETLRYAKACGMSVGIATGRATFILDRVIQQFHMEDIIDFVIGYNGVEIKDYRTGILDYTYRMDKTLTKEVALRIQDKPWNLVAYDESGRYVKYADERVIEYAKVNHQPYFVYDFENGERSWSKLSIISLGNHAFTKEEFQEMYAMNNEKYHGFETSNYSFEIVHSKVSKVKGIEHVCRKLGITMQEVMAFGDSGNDVAMLQAAGIGVAMANGTSDAKQAADVVTLSNEENGVAHYLHKYFERGGRV